MIFRKEIEIFSELSADEAIVLLRRATDKQRIFSDWTHFEFEGKIKKRKFAISRTTWYSNSFIPIIHGSIDDSKNGSKMRLRFVLHTAVKAFFIVATIFWIFIGSSLSIISEVFQGSFFLKIWMIPISIILTVLVGLVSFNYECKKSTIALMKLTNSRSAKQSLH